MFVLYISVLNGTYTVLLSIKYLKHFYNYRLQNLALLLLHMHVVALIYGYTCNCIISCIVFDLYSVQVLFENELLLI